MIPVLFEIGPLTIHSYGLMAATGFMVGTLVLMWLAKKEGQDVEKALDFAFYVVVSGLIGSRILYVLIEWEIYIERPWRVFMVWEGGLVFLGGFIFAGLTGLWYVRRNNLPAAKFADMSAPAIAIAHAFGRLGCFGAGCCYGKVTDSGLGVIFTHPDSLAPLNVPLYPTQLFSAANELIIFLILMAVRGKKKFDGQIFILWVILYSAGRFTIEFFRGDPRGGISVLSTSQWLVLGLFIFGIYLYRRLSRAPQKG